jgi:recombinational DNA repair protein (RecF pathway)
VRLSVLWSVLALEGWAPALEHCVRCGSAAPWERLRLDALAGGCLCERCLPPGVPSLGVDAWKAWMAAATGHPIPEVPRGAEAALRAWLQHQTGRPLRGPESLAPVLELP